MKWNTQFTGIKYALSNSKAIAQDTAFAYSAQPFPQDLDHILCLQLKIEFPETSDKGFDVAIKNYEKNEPITFDNQMGQLVAAGFSIKGGFTYLNIKGNKEVVKYTVNELGDINSGDVVSIFLNQKKGEMWFVLHGKNIGPVI